MLVALEILPPSDLAKQFIYKVSDIIDKTLIQPASWPREAEIDLTPHMLVFTRFNRLFLDDLSLFADCYEAFFVDAHLEASTIVELDELKRGVYAKGLTEEVWNR